MHQPFAHVPHRSYRHRAVIFVCTNSALRRNQIGRSTMDIWRHKSVMNDSPDLLFINRHLLLTCVGDENMLLLEIGAPY